MLSFNKVCQETLWQLLRTDRTLGRWWWEPDLKQWTYQKSTPGHTNPYSTWHDFQLSFPMFVTLSFTLFTFPHHFTAPNHMSILGYFSSTSITSLTTGSLCLLLFQKPYPQRIVWLALFFIQVSLINLHFWREVFPQLPVKKLHTSWQSICPFLDLSNINF